MVKHMSSRGTVLLQTSTQPALQGQLFTSLWHTVGKSCQCAVCLSAKPPQGQCWQDVGLLCALENMVSLPEPQETGPYSEEAKWLKLKHSPRQEALDSGHTLQVSLAVWVCHRHPLFSLVTAAVSVSNTPACHFSPSLKGNWVGGTYMLAQGSLPTSRGPALLQKQLVQSLPSVEACPLSLTPLLPSSPPSLPWQ